MKGVRVGTVQTGFPPSLSDPPPTDAPSAPVKRKPGSPCKCASRGLLGTHKQLSGPSRLNYLYEPAIVVGWIFEGTRMRTSRAVIIGDEKRGG